MHFKAVATTLLVAGAAASPYRRQASNESYCEDDVPVMKPTTTSAHYAPFPLNTTLPGVPSAPGSPSYPGKPSDGNGNAPSYPGKPSNPSNPGAGGNAPSYPGEKPSTPGGKPPVHPGKPSNGQQDGSKPFTPGAGNIPRPGKPTLPNPPAGGDDGKQATGNDAPSQPGTPGNGGGDSPFPSYPGKPSGPGSSNPGNNSPPFPGKPSVPGAPNPGSNSPSFPGKPSLPGKPSIPGGNNPPYPGNPSIPGSSSRPHVPYPQNTSIASVKPSFTTVPGVALPTESISITASSVGSNSTATAPTTTIGSSSSSSSSTSTSAISSSTPISNVPLGVPITSCTVPGTFALTFDDGPFTYTNHVLDLLAEAGAKATFFINGENFGNINDFQDVVKRMISDGHQIGSHTYSHLDLAKFGDADIINDMVRLEDSLMTIIGKYPTYMRPPFFSWNDNALSVLKALGYHVIHADVDSFDYNNNQPLGNLASVPIFEEGVNAGGSIALAHEVHQNTAEFLVPEFLRIMKEKNFRAVSVGECLGDPEANWYKTKRDSTPTPTAPPVTVSITSTSTPTGVTGPGGACGGPEGYVCEAGSCCSEYGYCGVTPSYCGAGCQPLFGVCGVAAPVPSGGSPTTTTSSPPAATPTSGGGGVSPDGSCGGANGYTCIPGTCCSEYGFCGTTNDHCGGGCQPAFGICS